MQQKISYRPIIFNGEKFNLKELRKKYKIFKVIDTYKQQLEDLFLIRNPKYKFNKNYQEDFENFVKKHQKGKPLEKCGNWVYFPWNGYLVHFLKEPLHQELRTARNKNLILKNEQEKFYKAKVAIAGLSVGSNAALVLALTGGAKYMNLADLDILAPSNLNRMNFDFLSIGKKKVDIVAERIYQLNPYSHLELFYDGVNEKNLNKFLNGVDILIEELDDIEMKVRLREEAKKRKIPVIMSTDNGDNVIIDIERFDKNPQRPIFHGRLKNVDISKVKESKEELFRVMEKIIDFKITASRAIESLMLVGKKLYSWPQLGTAAVLSGVVLAYLARKIIIGADIREGKLEVNLDYIFDKNFFKDRKKTLNLLKKIKLFQ